MTVPYNNKTIIIHRDRFTRRGQHGEIMFVSFLDLEQHQLKADGDCKFFTFRFYSLTTLYFSTKTS